MAERDITAGFSSSRPAVRTSFKTVLKISRRAADFTSTKVIISAVFLSTTQSIVFNRESCMAYQYACERWTHIRPIHPHLALVGSQRSYNHTLLRPNCTLLSAWLKMTIERWLTIHWQSCTPASKPGPSYSPCPCPHLHLSSDPPVDMLDLHSLMQIVPQERLWVDPSVHPWRRTDQR